MHNFNKGLASFLILILAVPSLITAASLPFGCAQTGTTVGGTLQNDTTWTPEGSPYVFVDNVTVAEGATLTITPGTSIDLKLCNLIIDGTLYARGNETNRIMFDGTKRLTFSWPPRIYFSPTSTPWNENSGTGCIIDYAQINVPNFQYETILGDYVYPKISNNIIYNYGDDAAAVRTNGLVVNNTILGGYRGIVAQSNTTILFNTIKYADVGISCGYMSFDPIYHPTIIGNLLTNNTVGIDDYGSAPYIANNTITGNTRGIYFTSYTFDRDAAPVGIIYNNIYNNKYNVFVDFKDQKCVNMANNWWGTTDASAIAKSIFDNTNSSAQGKIIFTPFLTSPNSQATSDIPITTSNPSPTTTPTPTSTPEQNAFLIESNSTVSALTFNGTSSEISFTVNGTTGTTGYVKATISKNFMPNGENIKVYLDGNLVNFSITSNDDSWIIIFTYHHSTHAVTINVGPPITKDMTPPTAAPTQTLFFGLDWVKITILTLMGAVVVLVIAVSVRALTRKESK
jgi:hypothetical protein